MPSRPPKPCKHQPCSRVTRDTYCEAHAPQYAALQAQRERARPSAAKRGYDSTWRKRRDEHLMREPLCRRCGNAGRDVHHIIAKAQGGSDHESNLATLCVGCHRSVTRRETDERAVRLALR